jgi:hypothetical protein
MDEDQFFDKAQIEIGATVAVFETVQTSTITQKARHLAAAGESELRKVSQKPSIGRRNLA